MTGAITDRNKGIFLLAITGLTIQEIANRKSISRSRVSQIVYKVRRQLKRLPDADPLPVDDECSLASMRAHCGYWLNQAAKVECSDSAG